MKPHLDVINRQEQSLPNPLEKHTAESHWQICNCASCQRFRMLIDSMPGKPIDYATYRHKDEKY